MKFKDTLTSSRVRMKQIINKKYKLTMSLNDPNQRMKDWIQTKTSKFYVNHVDKYMKESEKTPEQLLSQIKEDV